MKCPNCDQDIVPAQVHGETAEVCEACGGIWIETGELRPFVERILDRDPEFAADIEAPTDFPLAGTFYKTGRDCPVCAQQMEKIYYAYDSGVPVEHCVPCGGTWVEASNLEQLAAHLRENSEAIPRSGAGMVDFSYDESQSGRHRVTQLNPAAGLVLVAVCYAVFAYACYSVFQLGAVLQSERAAQTWIEHPGTLHDITMRTVWTTSGGSKLQVFAVRQHYTYNFRGTYYESNATWPNGDDWMTDEGMKERMMINKFVPNQPITVFVDPNDPSRSCLRRGVNPYRRTKDLPYYVVLAVLAAAGLVYTTWKVVQQYRSMDETP